MTPLSNVRNVSRSPRPSDSRNASSAASTGAHRARVCGASYRGQAQHVAAAVGRVTRPRHPLTLLERVDEADDDRRVEAQTLAQVLLRQILGGADEAEDEELPPGEPHPAERGLELETDVMAGLDQEVAGRGQRFGCPRRSHRKILRLERSSKLSMIYTDDHAPHPPRAPDPELHVPGRRPDAAVRASRRASRRRRAGGLRHRCS